MTQLGAPFQICTESPHFFQCYIMWTNHNLFSQSSIDGHEGCLNSLAISNSVMVNNPVCFQNVINLDLGKAGLVPRKNSAVQSPQLSSLCSEALLAPRLITYSSTTNGENRSFLEHQGCTIAGHNLRRSPDVGKIQPSSAKRMTSRNFQACSTKARLITVIS